MNGFFNIIWTIYSFIFNTIISFLVFFYTFFIFDYEPGFYNIYNSKSIIIAVLMLCLPLYAILELGSIMYFILVKKDYIIQNGQFNSNLAVKLFYMPFIMFGVFLLACVFTMPFI